MNSTLPPPEPPPSATGNHHHFMKNSTKLRLMCSNGGHILPRPHDKSLCYIGGETRMVVVDRHTSLLDLTRRLSKTLLRSSSSFTLKYQLPSEDLDLLISITTDEDLENMIDEYQRLNSSSRLLRLFIFPTNPQPISSFGSFLQKSIKSEDWFFNALNGNNSGFSDTSPVNSLLNLDDEISLPEKKDVNQIPNSPVMESFSSFGSASSTPSLANLPPIAEDLVASSAPAVVSASPVGSAAAIQELSDQFLSCPEKPKQGLQMANLNDRTDDQNIRIKIQEQILPQNQLHQQYTHRHPSEAVPVASYYHRPPMNQLNFAYYMPNFPLQKPPAAAIVSGNQTVMKTELPAGVYRTVISGAPQPVMIPSSNQIQNQPQYVGYSENFHQRSSDQLIYYATHAMQPLSAARYKRMASISPVEAGFQEHR